MIVGVIDDASPANLCVEKGAKMRLLGVSMFALNMLMASVCVAFASDDEPASSFEARSLKTLEAKDRAALRTLAAEFRKLSPEARRQLPLRIRNDSVELAFRGEFAGDKFRPEMLEYLVSSSAKDYESLLVIPATELERVQALRPICEKHAGEGRRQWWSAQLIWIEDDKPQAIGLSDLLVHLESRDQVQFLDQIGITSAGLGGTTNVRAESGLLPSKRVP